MARKKKAKINLLVRAGFSDSAAGRILAWVLTSFRIIVIVTEILVMLAFLSRFWLDARNTDLDEEIKQKQAVLSASQPFEKEFKDTQARLKMFTEFVKREDIKSKAMDAITSSLPPDSLLEIVMFSENGVEIKGASPSERSIQQFLVNLDAVELFKDIVLGEITATENNLLIFGVNIKT